MDDNRTLTVFYDGACPLCTREIAYYKRRNGADAIDWVDISRSQDEAVAPDLSRRQALARLHVRNADGELESGGAAFTRIWEALPGFRLLGRMTSLKPVAWILERAYRLFLNFRPRLQGLLTEGGDDGVALPTWLVRELRSDHAGETGAIAMYRAILAISRSEEIKAFAMSHLETERRHLGLIESVLPLRARSLFLPLWKLAGLLTGAIPAVFGRNAVYATIDAVETFVDRHYGAQVRRLSDEAIHDEVRELLERCRLDEVMHRDEARAGLQREAGPLGRLWQRAVAAGSAGAVVLARRL